METFNMKNQWPPSSRPSPSLLKSRPRGCCQNLLLQPRHTHTVALAVRLSGKMPPTQDTHRQTDNTFPVLWWKKRIHTGNKVAVELPNLLHEAHKKLSWLLFFSARSTQNHCVLCHYSRTLIFKSLKNGWHVCILFTFDLWNKVQNSHRLSSSARIFNTYNNTISFSSHLRSQKKLCTK